MLHAVARIDAERPVVEPDRDRNGKSALGIAQDFGHERVDARVLERAVELADRLPEERVVELGRELAAPGRGGLGRHALSLCGSRRPYGHPPHRSIP